MTLKSFVELAAIALLIYGFKHEEKVVAWEKKTWRSFKCFLRRQLRKSDRIVAWAEKPAKHGKPDYQFRLGQAGVWSKWSTY